MKHVQLGHADGCRGNKHRKQQPFSCPHIMHISYMKIILGGPWLLGAQGSRLPLPNGLIPPLLIVQNGSLDKNVSVCQYCEILLQFKITILFEYI